MPGAGTADDEPEAGPGRVVAVVVVDVGDADGPADGVRGRAALRRADPRGGGFSGVR